MAEFDSKTTTMNLLIEIICYLVLVLSHYRDFSIIIYEIFCTLILHTKLLLSYKLDLLINLFSNAYNNIKCGKEGFSTLLKCALVIPYFIQLFLPSWERWGVVEFTIANVDYIGKFLGRLDDISRQKLWKITGFGTGDCHADKITTIGMLAIKDVLIIPNHNSIEGGTTLLYLWHLNIWVLQHIEELAPVGSEKELIAYSIEDIDDAEEAFVELEDDLQLLLTYAICNARAGTVETGTSLCIKYFSHSV